LHTKKKEIAKILDDCAYLVIVLPRGARLVQVNVLSSLSAHGCSRICALPLSADGKADCLLELGRAGKKQGAPGGMLLSSLPDAGAVPWAWRRGSAKRLVSAIQRGSWGSTVF